MTKQAERNLNTLFLIIHYGAHQTEIYFQSTVNTEANKGNRLAPLIHCITDRDGQKNK